METRGCDYAWERPDPQWLAAQGYRFVSRYLSWDTTGKNLTADELVRLHGAGLSVMLNWEYNPRAASHGYDQGVADATEALRQADALGAPPTVAIYFSVDWDASIGDLPAICDYFRGVLSVLPDERVGVYGGLRVVLDITNHWPAMYGWQTYAWSGGIWAEAAHVRQVRNSVPTPYGGIDEDVALVSDFGQWQPEVQGMGSYGFSDPDYADRLAWRGDALAKMLDKVAGGPSAGEDMLLVQMLNFIRSQVVGNGSSLSSLLSKVDSLAAEVATLKAQQPTTTGTVHVSGDLTVGQ